MAFSWKPYLRYRLVQNQQTDRFYKQSHQLSNLSHMLYLKVREQIQYHQIYNCHCPIGSVLLSDRILYRIKVWRIFLFFILSKIFEIIKICSFLQIFAKLEIFVKLFGEITEWTPVEI